MAKSYLYKRPTKLEKQTKEEMTRKQIVEAIQAEYDERKLKRRELELQWNLNMDFYSGKQNRLITKFNTVIDVGKQFHWQQSESFNHIAPIIESRLARISTYLNEKKASVIEEQPLIDPSLAEQATQWSEITGTAFYKIFWVADQNGGRAQVSVCSPFEIFPDNQSAGDINEVSSLIHAKDLPVALIKDNWGVDLSHLGTDSVTVLERYERPSKERELGRLTIVAGEKLLYDGELPFMNEEGGVRGLPFVRQTSESNSWNFFGKSVIERAIPVQRAYNTVKNRKVEFLNRMACGVLAVEEGSVDLESLEFDGLAPGKVIVYRQGMTPPQFMETGTLPAELEREEERLLHEFETISGGGDITRTAKGNLTTATALEILETRDENRMSRTLNSARRAITEATAQIQRLRSQFTQPDEEVA